MEISNQFGCNQIFNNSFKRFNYPLNIENSKDITSLGKAKIIYGPHIFSNINFYKFNKSLLNSNSNSSSNSMSMGHNVKKEYNKNELANISKKNNEDFEIIFEIIENKKFFFIFPKKSIVETLTITEPYEIIISIESTNSENSINQDNNILIISGASKLLLDTMNNYFENYIQNQNFNNINKLNIPNKNLVIFNFQYSEFQSNSNSKNEKEKKSETGIPEIQDNNLVQKSLENTNKILKKKFNSNYDKNADNKHILGKVSKMSKNILKIPSKYPINKNLYGKKNISPSSTTISNETTVMTSGQVSSLNNHYQNASSPLYSLAIPSNSSSNQNSNSSMSGPTKCCSYCGCKSTPIWRRGPEGTGTLCNACGVKWKSGKILTNDPPTNIKMNMNKHGSTGNYNESMLSNKLNNIMSSNMKK
ncbi:hypothetical protein H8356DRAFT_1639446 [Neocallimastix lanati (nom. inval.)]|nr:hypothetical protein H8356DRAFT_1639446 [Neocallimastix sp. JGI-2020a]